MKAQTLVGFFDDFEHVAAAPAVGDAVPSSEMVALGRSACWSDPALLLQAIDQLVQCAGRIIERFPDTPHAVSAEEIKAACEELLTALPEGMDAAEAARERLWPRVQSAIDRIDPSVLTGAPLALATLDVFREDIDPKQQAVKEAAALRRVQLANDLFS